MLGCVEDFVRGNGGRRAFQTGELQSPACPTARHLTQKCELRHCHFLNPSAWPGTVGRKFPGKGTQFSPCQTFGMPLWLPLRRLFSFSLDHVCHFLSQGLPPFGEKFGSRVRPFQYDSAQQALVGNVGHCAGSAGSHWPLLLGRHNLRCGSIYPAGECYLPTVFLGGQDCSSVVTTLSPSSR